MAYHRYHIEGGKIGIEESLQELVHLAFGNGDINSEVQKVVFSYLTADFNSLAVTGKEIIPAEIWNTLSTSICKTPIPVYRLLVLLKLKALEIQRRCKRSDAFSEVDYVKINSIVICGLKYILSDITQAMQGASKCDNLLSRKRISIDESCESIGEPVHLQMRNFALLISCLEGCICEDLQDIFDTTLKLLYVNNSINVSPIYFSLLSSSYDLLKEFCQKELKFIKTETLNPESFLQMFIHSITGSNILRGLYDILLSVINDRTPSNEILFNMSQLYIPLYHVLFLNGYWSTEDKLKWSSHFEVLSQKYSNSADLLLKSIVSEKQRHLSIVQWCLKQEASLSTINMLKLLEDHSVLHTLQASVPLHKIPYEKVLEILEDGNHKATSSLIYSGYYILFLSFNTIIIGIEMDKLVNSWRRMKLSSNSETFGCQKIDEVYFSKCMQFYKVKIVKLLEKLKRIFKDKVVSHLEFAIEVLENAFSLLFLEHTSISDELSNISSCDEIETLSPSSSKEELENVCSNSVTSSVDNAFHSFFSDQSSGLQKAKEDAISKEMDDGKERASSTLAGKDGLTTFSLAEINVNVSSDFSSSSINDFSNRGYIINAVVLWDHILLLRDLIAAVKEERDVRDCWERLDSLEEKVADALWRLKLLMPNYQDREMGSEDILLPYMNEALLPNFSKVVRYDCVEALKLNSKCKSTPIRDQKGLIYFLFATPQNLLNIAQVSYNLDGAQKVLNKYQLGNCVGNQEIVLMKCLSENIPKLEKLYGLKTNKNVEPSDMKKAEDFGTSQIQQTIRSDMHEVAASMLTDQIINLYMLENCDESNFCQSQLFPKLVLIDIAMTSEVSADYALKLLGTTHSPVAAEVPKVIPVCLSNLLSSLNDNSPLTAFIASLQELNNGTYGMFTSLNPYVWNGVNLLLSNHPLCEERLKATKMEWSSLVDCIIRFIGNCIQRTNWLKLTFINPDLINFFCTIMDAVGEASSIFNENYDGNRIFDYLKALLENLKLMESVIVEHKTVSPKTKMHIQKNLFGLLNEQPVRIFGELLFITGIDPLHLETISSNMQLDLLTVIVTYAFPSIPIAMRDEVKDCKETFGCYFKDGNYILNGSKLFGCKPLNANRTVSDLLSLLIDRLKDIFTYEFNILDGNYVLSSSSSPIFLKDPEIKNILLETADICFVDLSRFDSGRERLVFFVNLANLMVLHAALLNALIFHSKYNCLGVFSNSNLDLYLSMKHMGYIVGELGFVSLYDVLVKILKQPVVLPDFSQSIIFGNEDPMKAPIFSKLLPEINRELIFVVSQVVNPSPKINVYYVDTFEENIASAKSEYFCHFILPQNLETFKDAEVNALMASFINLYGGNINAAVDQLKENLNKELTLYLNWLKKFGYKKYITPVKKVAHFGLFPRIEYCTKEIIELTNLPSMFEPSMIHPSKEKSKLSSEIYMYVKSRCPIISIFLEWFCESDRCSPEKGYAKTVLINLFTYTKGTQNISEDDILHLFQKPDYLSIIHNIETTLDRPASSCYKKMLNLFHYLCDLPTLEFCNHVQLQYLRDQVLVWLVSKGIDHREDCLSYTFLIKDSLLRFHAFKNFYRNWPLAAAIACLKFLEADNSLCESSNGWIKKKLRQLEIFVELEKVTRGRFKENVMSVAPREVVEFLSTQKHYGLLVKFIQCQNLTEEFPEVVAQSLLLESLDVIKPNFDAANQILSTISLDILEKLILVLLNSLNISDARYFLISEYLQKTSKASNMSLIKYLSLRQELMGIVLIEKVAPKYMCKTQLFPLIKKPHLILEQWIMNLKFDAVERALESLEVYLNAVEDSGVTQGDCLSWSSFNEMIERYAQKALDMSDVEVNSKEIVVKESPAQFIIPLQIPSKMDWQQNSTTNVCSVCETAIFSLFCRRHHCRRCGRVVCASCSKYQFKVEGYNTLVRVCKQCFKSLCPSSERDFGEPRRSWRSSFSFTDVSEDFSCHSEVGWYFSDESNQIRTVREEFSYDCAPSLSLCLALLSLHREDRRASLCILGMCQKLFLLIIDALNAEHTELDINFLLKMIETLVSSAKLRFGKVTDNNGIALCEYYSQWVDLVLLLFDSNCTNLIPSGCLKNAVRTAELQMQQFAGLTINHSDIRQNLDLERKFLRTLRDSLVKNELWSLALDVSTKAGFEISGVWGALAMASLKAGDFTLARENFCKVLNKRRDKNVSVKSFLLNDIISYLESQPYFFKSKIGEIERSPPDEQLLKSTSEALIDTHTLSKLNLIANGALKYDSEDEHSLDPLLQRECEYYLTLYGCHRTFLQFLLRHERVLDAVKYSQQMYVAEDIFVEEVALTMFRRGKFSLLWRLIQKVDPDEKWSPLILLASCKWLEKNKFYHCLLEIQNCLEDHLRCAITLIKLYSENASSFSDLLQRKHYLTDVVYHLQEYLNLIPLSENSAKPQNLEGLAALRMHSSSWAINQQIHLCDFQDDVVKYLGEVNEGILRNLLADIHKIVRVTKSETPAHHFTCVPTVFDNDDGLSVSVVALCLGGNIPKGLSLIYRLVEINSIHPKDLLLTTLRVFVHRREYKDMSILIKGILEWGLIPDSQIKCILWPTILWAGGNAPENVVKSLVKFLPLPTEKISAYMEAGLLKLAYFETLENGKAKDFQKLLEMAIERQDKTIIYNCQKLLQKFNLRNARE